MAKLSPVLQDSQFDTQGNFLVGGKIYTYIAGSTTPTATFTTAAGNVQQSNPIILNAEGRVDDPIWLSEGQTYKLRLFNSDDTFTGLEFDNITGVGDNLITTIDQWISTSLNPTYINATTFTLAGDQTSTIQVGRRLKISVTGGTIFATVITSVYTTLTTVTIDPDSGVLDSGISDISYGIISSIDPSVPLLTDSYPLASGSVDKTKKVRLELDGLTTATTRVMTVPDKDITIAGLSDVRGGTNLGSKLQPLTAAVASNLITATLAPTALDFRNGTLTNGVVTTVEVPSISITTTTIASSLGATTAVPATIIVLVAYNGGTPVLCFVNATGATDLSESNLISPTTISAGATSANTFYSASAVSANSPYRIVGYLIGTWTSGTGWALSKVQPFGGAQSITSLNAFGANQTWQTVTGSRAAATPYKNETTRIIYVSVKGSTNTGAALTLTVDGIEIDFYQGHSASPIPGYVRGPVPPGSTYQVDVTATGITAWKELR